MIGKIAKTLLALVVVFGSLASAEEKCPLRELMKIADTTVYSGPGDVLVFESGMFVDADGSPTAYHPRDEGLDSLSNAGEPGNWAGIVVDENGEPVVQGPDDPAPGFYVSQTALSDSNRARTDPRRYVDSLVIPFVSIPRYLRSVRMGDYALVTNRRNGRSAFAIVADIGPHDLIGEGSIALARALGIRSDARNGGVEGGVRYLIFQNSGDGKPHSEAEINAAAAAQFEAWREDTCTDGEGACANLCN